MDKQLILQQGKFTIQLGIHHGMGRRSTWFWHHDALCFRAKPPQENIPHDQVQEVMQIASMHANAILLGAYSFTLTVHQVEENVAAAV